MRRTPFFLRRRKGRAPEHGPFKFEELLPLQLKNQVSSKSSRGSETACIQDMAVMFACIKKNEFNELLCSKEIGKFLECYNKYEALRKQQKIQEQSGKDTSPGSKTLTQKQLNRLLEKHPQFNEPRHNLYYK